MVPLSLSMNKLALDLHVHVTRLAEIVHEPPEYHSRYGIATGSLLQHECTILAERTGRQIGEPSYKKCEALLFLLSGSFGGERNL